MSCIVFFSSAIMPETPYRFLLRKLAVMYAESPSLMALELVQEESGGAACRATSKVYSHFLIRHGARAQRSSSCSVFRK